MSVDNSNEPKPRQVHPVVDFIGGTISGMAALTVGYPLDTIKVRFQNPETSGKYSTTFGAFTTIVREERIAGLFKGISSPMMACAFINGLVFGSYGSLMRMQLKNEDDLPTLTQITLAGAGTGIITSVIVCPTELIKIRQQAMLSATRIPSAFEVAADIFRRQGVRGLYRGITTTALRDCSYGIYFCTYEGTCRFLRPSPPPRSRIDTDTDTAAHHQNHASLIDEVEDEFSHLSWTRLLVAGGLAGVMSWIVTFPVDVIKTRMQATEWYPRGESESLRSTVSSAVAGARSQASTSSALPQPAAVTWSTVGVRRASSATRIERHPYRTTWSSFVNSYRAEGWRVFYMGLSPTLIRSIPVNMVTFGVFEMVVGLMGR
ncbi:hypothetical protein BOTBODRAFT_153382 [Botryobasidium botryosum FD-172 SS1]|uniref:Mitochondrial carrier n=1 Tax=Botryobasidium botryosum (strain FD-172 SS1) TaxID=930990 RepID=A0A067MUP8_BOTB1|nr:hypothetical protein BOTBODRAFT_153382 [Botryobasidium botryosum FD-172 SS1]